MVGKIIVITSYEKNGVTYYTLNFLSEFSDYEMENGAAGVKVGTAWTSLSACSTLRVNDLVDLRYEPGFKGQAQLADVVRYSPNDKHYLNNFSVPDFKVAVAGKPDKETASNTETAASAKGGK